MGLSRRRKLPVHIMLETRPVQCATGTLSSGFLQALMRAFIRLVQPCRGKLDANPATDQAVNISGPAASQV